MALEQQSPAVTVVRCARSNALLRDSKFKIRTATLEDAAGILGILRAAFDEYRCDYTEAAYLDTVLTRDALRTRMANSTVFVALDHSDRIVGTVSCNQINNQEGHVRGMAVRPEWQGAGLAAQLLQCAEAELSERSCAVVTLDTTQPLRRAMRFYERNGYRRSGRVTDFFGMPLIEYVKKLPPLGWVDNQS